MSDADSSPPPAPGDLPGWEPYIDSGIPEIVAQMFPPEPGREQFTRPDGSVDEDAFEDAHSDWRDESLDLAYQAARLPELLERLARAEHAATAETRNGEAERFRDAVIDLLQRDPLPVEPVKDDYLVTIAPSYEGEFEDMRFAWDHSQWRSDFQTAALRRDQVLQELLQEGGPRTSFLPEQFQKEWLPADLIALHALRTLVDSGSVDMGEPVTERLRAMLFAADPEIRVPDPDDPGGVELYAGEASEAHDWVPPGIYDATGPDGDGEFRLVVGTIPGSPDTTASAAFPPAQHDSQVLNEIARTLEQDTEKHEPAEVLRRVNRAVQGSGRIGALPGDLAPAPEPPLSRLEQGAMLSELLKEREQNLDTPPEEPRPDAPGPGPERNL